jgi:glycosyltransferase involved in cell wall biosynthesis
MVNLDLGWRWDQWYSRNITTAFLTNLVARGLAQRRLARTLVANHRKRSYDVLYQFSAIEVFGLRRFLKALPPLIIYPETHIAGELRAWRREDTLIRRCEPAYRRTIIPLVLLARAARQRRDIKFATTVVCISDVFGSWINRDYDVDPERCVTIPNPVDLDLFAPRLRHRPEEAPLRVLFLGRISVRKGVEQIVQLSDRLKDLAGKIQIRIVGGHTMWSDYRPLLNHLDPQIAVYVGPVSPEQVREELANADMLIQPSTYEPFGLTTAEALAMGVPVIVSDEVGAAEHVSSACCWRFPAGDVDAFEGAVRAALREATSPAWDRVRTVSRAEAERLFGPKAVAAAVVNVLETSRGRHGSAGR